jgi:hypothetical protein
VKSCTNFFRSFSPIKTLKSSASVKYWTLQLMARKRKMLKRHLAKFRMGPEHKVYTWPAQSPYWAICRQTGTEIGVNIPEIGNSVVANPSVIHLSYYNWWGLLSHPRLLSPQNSTPAHNYWGKRALLSAHKPGFYFKGKSPIHPSSIINDFSC